MPKSYVNFMLKQVKPLVGGTITSLVKDNKDEFYGFIVQARNGIHYTVWILQDDEGNGPGSLDIVKGT